MRWPASRCVDIRPGRLICRGCYGSVPPVNIEQVRAKYEDSSVLSDFLNFDAIRYRVTTPRIRTGPIRSIRAGAVGSVFDAPARISNTAARAACHALSCTLVLVDAGKCADGNRHAIRQARCSGHDIAQVDGGNAAGALQERAGAVWPGSKMIGRPIVSPGTRRSPGSHGMPIPVRFAASIGCGAAICRPTAGSW